MPAWRSPPAIFSDFLDADDLVDGDTVETHLDNFEAATRTRMVGRLGLGICVSIAGRDRRAAISTPAAADRLAVGSDLRAAESFRRVGSFDNEARDWPWIDWAHRAKLRGLVFATVDKMVLRRRLHPSSLSMRQGIGAASI